MMFKTLITSAFAATTFGLSIPQAGDMGCGTAPPNPAQLAAHKDMAIAEAETDVTKRDAAAITYIDTYVHVVSNGTDASSWYLSVRILSIFWIRSLPISVSILTLASQRDTIDAQIAVLNQDFAGTPYQYLLQDVDWTINSSWAVGISNVDETDMKLALRRGDYRTLNLYYLTDISGHHTNTGHCGYPFSNATSRPDWLAYDGCVMSAWTVPGGDSSRFSTGRITVHEVGHWHNLIHTFDGNNCKGPGDYVSDTPAEGYASDGCPTGRDTCPGIAGVDPIHNHMDYSDDSCRTEFTPGQIARMQSSWAYYRAYAN